MNTRNLVPVFIASLAFALWSTSSSSDIRFTDVSEEAGVTHQSETYGASWGDLDGDGFPDLFVSNHRSIPSLFLNAGDGTFLDVARQTSTWLNRQEADQHGGAWFDFDNDGDQDLLVGTGRGNFDQLFVNDRGALIDRTEALGLLRDDLGSRLAIWNDFDGDGLPDFLMTQMAGIARYFRQLPGGGFAEETEAVSVVCRPAQYALLIDVTDNDRLDVACPDRDVFPWRVWDTRPVPWANITSRMTPVDNVPDSVIADFDNDGRLDVFHISRAQLRPSGASLSNDGHVIESILIGGEKGFDFATSGDLTFEMDWNQLNPETLQRVRIGAGEFRPNQVPFELSPDDPRFAGAPPDDGEPPLMRIWYDPASERWSLRLRTVNDDNETVWSDSFIRISSTAPVTSLNEVGMWAGDRPQRPTLLMNRPGGFVDETDRAGLDEEIQCVSATAGDFDNDMHIDLFLACRTATRNIENRIYRNLGDGTFELVPDAGGAAGPTGLAVTDGVGTADSVVTADYDVDGYLDVFVTNGFNMRPVRQGGENLLFRNAGSGNNWIHLDLVGTDSHREAIGARVTAHANSVTQTRVKNGSYHRWSHDHTRMHFGLADAESVDITIHWPSGLMEVHEAVTPNAVYRATEGEGIEPVALGDAPPYPCGLPGDLDPAVDRGVFVARNCRNGSWELRVASGNTESMALTFPGHLVSSAPMNDFVPRGVEVFDTLEMESEGRQITFEFNVRATDMDGFDVRPQPGADTCLTVTPPAGLEVYMGPMRRPVPVQFDLNTVGACAGDIPDAPPAPPPPPDEEPSPPVEEPPPGEEPPVPGEEDPPGSADDETPPVDPGEDPPANGGEPDDGAPGDGDGENPPGGGQTSAGEDGGSGSMGFITLLGLVGLAGWRRLREYAPASRSLLIEQPLTRTTGSSQGER